MAPLKTLSFAAIAAAAALLTAPMMGLSGGIPSTM